MPTNLAAGDFVQVRLIYKGPTGQEANNILHYVIGGVTGIVTDKDFADNVMSSFFVSILNALPTNVTLDGCETTIINRIPLPLTQTSTLHAGPGINPATFTLNTQVAGIISWGTAFAGRAFRGRTYFPWVPNTALLTTGFPSAAYVTLLTSIATHFIGLTSITGSGGSGTCFQIIYHRHSRLADAILNFAVQAKFATQRRRGNYGKNRTPPI